MIEQKKQLKNQSGFTLLEILITITIFVFMVTAVAGIYVAFSRVQKQASIAQQLLNDGQYALEVVSREIRSGEIFDYTPDDTECTNLVNVTGKVYENCLFIIKEDGQLVGFVTGINSSDNLDRRLSYLILECDPGYTNCRHDKYDTYALSNILGSYPNGIIVKDMSYIITPTSSPYISGGPNLQPRVTIRLEVGYLGAPQYADLSQVLQTTVVSRVYKR